MPVSLTYELTGADAVGRDLDAVAQRGRDMSRPIGQTLLRVVRRTAQELKTGQLGVKTRHGTAGLAGSLTFEVQPLAGSIGSNKAYARYLQKGMPGGRLESPTGKWLTIPIAENVGAKGDPKYASARDVPGGFVWTSPAGNLFIASAGKRSKREYKKPHKGRIAKAADQIMAGAGGLVLWFLLRKSVKAEAHNFVRWKEPQDTNVWNRFARRWLLRGE